MSTWYRSGTTCFDQQAFIEAVRVAAVAIAQASGAGSQGGPSNLQIFKSHHPPTFTGGGDCCHLICVDGKSRTET